MTIKKSAQASVLAAMLALCATNALSADNSFHIGVSNITVHSRSPDLTSNGPAFLTPQPSGVTVDNAATLTFGYLRRLDANWDFDLLLGVPPAHSVRGTGKLAPFGVIAEIKQFAPTAMFNYNFGAEGSKWRPFAGVGVNFTRFFDATSTASGNIATGGPTKISLTDSFGLAAQAGVSVRVNEKWSLTASVAAAKVQTNMLTSTGSIERRTEVDLRPVVFSAGVVYGF